MKIAAREEKRDAPVTCLRVTYFARSTALKENERQLVVYSEPVNNTG